MVDEDTMFNSLVLCVSVLITAFTISCLKICLYIEKRHILKLKKDGLSLSLSPLLSNNASLSTSPN